MKPPAARSRRLTTARVGAVVWPSFFAAGVATTVFFAVVDRLELAAITWARLPVTRGAGYTLGFFMFWMCTFSSSAFTAWLASAPRDSAGRQ
ncbi:MAG TPA: hypothetical protein VJ724_02975 [Tahibacter sp.]|nr:hypothetical protein [Tahibacter sp.]